MFGIANPIIPQDVCGSNNITVSTTRLKFIFTTYSDTQRATSVPTKFYQILRLILKIMPISFDLSLRLKYKTHLLKFCLRIGENKIYSSVLC